MKTVFIVGASSGINVGDNLFFECALRDFTNEDPDLRFAIPARNPDWFARYLNQYSVELIPIRNSDLFLRPFSTLFRALKAMQHSDLVIIMAGMYYDWALFDPRQNSLLLFPILVAAARILRTPIGSYCAGVGPIHTRLGQHLIRCVFNALTFIILRDETSERVLRTIGVTRPPTFVTVDPAVDIAPADDETINDMLASNDVPTGGVLVGLSVNYLMDAMMRPNNRLDESRFVEIMGSVADTIVEDFDATVVLMVMCSRDADVTEKIQRRMAHRRNVRSIRLHTRYAPSEIAGIISRLDAMIGMRLHSVVISTATGVPTIAISYAPKVQSYMEMVEQTNYVVELSQLTSENMCSKFRELWVCKESVRESLVSRIAELKSLSNSAKIAMRYSKGKQTEGAR